LIRSPEKRADLPAARNVRADSIEVHEQAPTPGGPAVLLELPEVYISPCRRASLTAAKAALGRSSGAARVFSVQTDPFER